MNSEQKYDLVIGLEIHVQLQTKSKLFCSDSNSYGDPPNTNVGPISLAHPGTLPKLNVKALEYAIKMGLACQSTIAEYCRFDRKSYFYPDLPKGYQITQKFHPICLGGEIAINTSLGRKSIKISAIQLEEDSGKSIHHHDQTLIDFNRAGAPLIEIITEPQLSSPEEASDFIVQTQKIVRYLGISDGNMEDGSLRCDVNISLKNKSESVKSHKVEIKNLNSIRHVRQAANYEQKRLSDRLNKHLPTIQETRRFLDKDGTTISIRNKELSQEYRYIPEPDLPAIKISKEWISEIQSNMPKLHFDLQDELQENFGISKEYAEIITETRESAAYFEGLVNKTKNFKSAANWMIGPIRNYLNKTGTGIESFPVKPVQLADMIEMIDSKKISFSSASTKLLPELILDPESDPKDLARKLNLLQENDVDSLISIIRSVIDKYPDEVKSYKNGKNNLLNLFIGLVMKATNGSANPTLARDLLIKEINNQTDFKTNRNDN